MTNTHDALLNIAKRYREEALRAQGVLQHITANEYLEILERSRLASEALKEFQKHCLQKGVTT